MPVQSVRFSTSESPRSVNRGRGWTAGAARAWLRANGYLAPRPRPTTNQLRFRQFQPEIGNPDSFRTITDGVPRGVQLVECQTVPDGVVIVDSSQ